MPETPPASDAAPAGARRPIVGICTALDRARWSVWDLDAALVPHNYIEAVQRAGGIALLVPPDAALAEDPDAVLDLVDGLMLVGGPDVDPARYGAERHPRPSGRCRCATRSRSPWCGARSPAASRSLGICRGMQVLNVAAGGTLRQHLPDDPAMADHRRALGSFEGADHDVDLEEGSRALAAAGGSPHRVKSHHHQGVSDVGEGLRVTGWAAEDGLAEAVEGEGQDYLLGVQWHPEADPRSGLIGSLVAAAAEARSRREAAPA